MTYKSFKKSLLIGFCISASPQALSAFQPTAPLHKIAFSSSANSAVGGRRRPFAGAGFSQEEKHSVLLAPGKSALYYKNLDDHEEQQQQQQQQRQDLPRSAAGPVPTFTSPHQPDEGNGNANKDNNGSSPLLLEENKELRSNTTTAASALPSAIDLPKSFFIKTNEAQNAKLQELFLSTEMLIGRIAMIMAVYLLTEEVLTGSSILDQLQNLSN